MPVFARQNDGQLRDKALQHFEGLLPDPLFQALPLFVHAAERLAISRHRPGSSDMRSSKPGPFFQPPEPRRVQARRMEKPTAAAGSLLFSNRPPP